MHSKFSNVDVQNIADKFDIEGKIISAEIHEGGHINDTFLVKTDVHPVFVQRVNHFVFPNPEEIMENMCGVTEFLRDKMLRLGRNPLRETITLIKTKDGGNFYKDTQGNYWRSFIDIEDTTAHYFATSVDMLYESGAAFGDFISLLGDYPAHTLHEVIPNFHNTVSRLEQLDTAVKNNPLNRVNDIKNELHFVEERKKDMSILMDMLNTKTLPLKVTHNDTKMSNVLLDNDTNKRVAVIDLDTVMPGAVAFDFGDSIRAGATTAAEDEADLAKVNFSIEMFEAYTKGFLEEAGNSLSQNELHSLSLGAKIMTFEVGTRFLADYINGDIYFKTKYPEHNLVRARNQFKLVLDMEENMDKMQEIVKKYSAHE